MAGAEQRKERLPGRVDRAFLPWAWERDGSELRLLLCDTENALSASLSVLPEGLGLSAARTD